MSPNTVSRGNLAQRSTQLAILSDSVSIFLAFTLSFAIKFVQPAGTREALPYALVVSAGVLFIWIIALAASGAYSHSSVSNGVLNASAAIRATVFAFMMTASISYIFKAEFSRIFILFAFPAGLLFMMLGRRIVRQHLIRQVQLGKHNQRALVISRDDREAPIAGLIDSSPELIMTLAAVVKLSRGELENEGTVEEIIRLAQQHDASAVVLSPGLHLDNVQISDLSWKLDSLDIELLVVPDFLGSWVSRLNIERHDSLPLVQLIEPRLSPFQSVQKRLLDLSIAIPAFLLSLPFLVAIGILVKLTSKGPVFFVQPRVGAEGRAFPFYKFRSMRVGAEAERQSVLGRPDEGMAERYKSDPRVTPFGKFIRRFSLDETPQMWNVIRGEMSLVGPRPMLFEELPQLDSLAVRRHLAKPGLTGLWQISGRKETSWEERMLLDLRYIDEWSIGLDLAIIARTFRVIFSGQGSY